jgi:hypothetical protein
MKWKEKIIMKEYDEFREDMHGQESNLSDWEVF